MRAVAADGDGLAALAVVARALAARDPQTGRPPAPAPAPAAAKIAQTDRRRAGGERSSVPETVDRPARLGRGER